MVVKPDIASKKASVTLMGVVQNIKGSMPKIENTTHTRAVSRKPSRLPMWFCDDRTRRVRHSPTSSVKPQVRAKQSQSASP